MQKITDWIKTYKLKDLKLSIPREHLLHIELDRPEASNAFSMEMIESLCRVLMLADRDPDIRVMMLSGGGKNFCAGGDVQNMIEQSGMFGGDSVELMNKYRHGIQQIPKTMEEISTPVVAMVNGRAVGAGCDLACMCDLRVGSTHTQFAETFNQLGLVPGDGGTFFLTRLIGFSRAMQMFMTCEWVAGAKAYEYGLLNFMLEGEDDKNKLLEKTIDVCLGLLQKDPTALAMTKKAMKISYLHDLHTSLDLLAAYQGMAQRTKGHLDRVESLAAKINIKKK